MQSQPITAADLAKLGREWISAWNSHDLERILALYAEDAEMTSDRIQALGLEASGTLRGKDKLRMYWGKAFQLLPNLHFDLIDTYVSPDSVVVFYRNERGAQICEYLRLDAEGQDQAGVGEPSGALAPAVIPGRAKREPGCDSRAHAHPSRSRAIASHPE